MIFKETRLHGAFVIEPERHQDERGFFARTWCRRAFESQGINPNLVQCNISFNEHRGTLRGMHYQAAPFEEAKLVRCTRGRIYDVIIDLRPESPSFKQHIGVELSSENQLMLYVPEGFAHGFLTLEDRSEVFYQMSEFFEPTSARGIRWNDPAFEIRWPEPVRVIKERDQNYPDFVDPTPSTNGVQDLTSANAFGGDGSCHAPAYCRSLPHLSQHHWRWHAPYPSHAQKIYSAEDL